MQLYLLIMFSTDVRIIIKSLTSKLYTHFHTYNDDDKELYN